MAAESRANTEPEEELLDFHDMGLDDRILKALADTLKWRKPTLIQEKVIPLALEGKDILARARTGTGKTACFLIPIIQKILESKKIEKILKSRVLVMCPSKELCNQAYKHIQELTSCCSREVQAVDISGQMAPESMKPLLMKKPDIIVGTPSRVLAHIKAGNLNLKKDLEMLVVDEADLVFSFGYEADMKQLTSHLPQIYQAFLMSATLGDDVRTLKKLVLHNPVVVKLEETSLPDTKQLTQYHIKCEDEDKFVLLYTLLKLHLIQGKSLVFVNSIDRCYKLKLFLGHVGIMTCVLNPEMPVNSRCHIVGQFNDNVYNIIIASDEAKLDSKKVGRIKKKGKAGKDFESGVARGIDFQSLSNVINFDFPNSTDAYIHRVGRTARAQNQGAALSLVSIKEMPKLEAVKQQLAGEYADPDSIFQPFNFKMDEIEGFRYRARDAYRATTSLAVKQARMKEIKQEILTSEKLKTYFEENPRDVQVLRHDGSSGGTKLQQHLKNVPDYIVPETLKNRMKSTKVKPKAKKRTLSHTQQQYKKKKSDALKSFEFSKLGGGGKRKKKS